MVWFGRKRGRHGVSHCSANGIKRTGGATSRFLFCFGKIVVGLLVKADLIG